MLLPLLLLFTVVPLIELALLIWIGGHIGVIQTVALVLLTGIVGASMARAEGWRTVRRIQKDLNRGRMPADAMVQAACILVAGALLVTPGVVTDAVGMSLLIPTVRHLVAARIIRAFRDRIQVTQVGGEPPRERRHVDATYKRVDDDE
jgi:UPF0716 protein FxsA